LGVGFFLETTLRVWAEQIVYGPLGGLGFAFLRSLLFLFAPYLIFNLIRFIIRL